VVPIVLPYFLFFSARVFLLVSLMPLIDLRLFYFYEMFSVKCSEHYFSNREKTCSSRKEIEEEEQIRVRVCVEDLSRCFFYSFSDSFCACRSVLMCYLFSTLLLTSFLFENHLTFYSSLVSFFSCRL